MLKGMGVLMGRGMEKEWSCIGIASSSRVVVVCCGRVVVAWLRSASSLHGFVPRRRRVALFRIVVVVRRHVASSLRVGVRGRSLLLYLVVGIGRRVVVVVGGVVVWWLWWLMEERKYVTHCDISVMFELTHEIT